MLLRFRTANVRSLRDEQELSFVAPPSEAAASARTVETGAGEDIDVYPVLGIFGANASGKSNVLTAMVQMRNAVLNSYAQWASYRGIPREVFALDAKAVEESSFFEVDVLLDGVRWTYGFELGPERVTGEWLHSYPQGRRQVWMDRDVEREDEFRFPGTRIKDRARLARTTRPNALFLSRAATDNHPQLLPLFYWFQRNLWLINPEDDRSQREAYTAQQLSSVRRERIEELLRVADLGITGVRIDPRADAEGRVQLLHEGHQGTAAAFDWEHESFGTRSWFALLGPVLLALDEGAVLLLDELDSSLHPRMAAEVIRLFRDPMVNAGGAQLVFTTHDVAVLQTPAGVRLLDPGQIWLTEKDRTGATELYPLTAAEPGEEEDLPRSYLSGAFGGVPAVTEGQVGRRLLATQEREAAEHV
ncbi:ATP-binding protein [Nocardiopsis rhodophaea]|uniref:ATP-binding protein n=1 Tax=Nocardiopsis rhodophaea TaxID=280238 RepID=A0ABN2T180_9ACTN